MSNKQKKQFGVWMNNNQATVVGRSEQNPDSLEVLGQIKSDYAGSNSSEHTANNQQKTLQSKYFKDITYLMPNAEEIHITGTGIAQEQFKHYLADTPQFKNTKTTDCTSNEMNDDKLVSFFEEQFK